MKLQRILRILSVILVLVTFGCQSTTPISVDDIKPSNVNKLTVGTEKSLSVNAAGSGLEFAWTTTGGKIIGENNTPGIVFQAPNQPGSVIVSVRVKDAFGQEETRTIDFVIEALPTAVSFEAAAAPTVEEPTATEAAPTIAPAPTATQVPPDPTPTAISLLIDPLDDYSSWTTSFCDEECGGGNGASSLMISSQPGRFGKAVQVEFDLKKDGYVLFSRSLEGRLPVDAGGMSFYYRGSGQVNTLELKLLFKFPGEDTDTAYGFMVNNITNTKDAWMKMEVPIDKITCWWPEDHCTKYGEKLVDFSHLRWMDFAISNKSHLLDQPGAGVILLDQLERMP